VHAVPATEPAAKGKAIVNLLQLSPEEKLATTVAVREFRDDASLLFATERGVIKKTELSAYGNPRPSGIIAISIDPGDRLLQVRLAEPGHDVLFATAQGYAIRFPESDVRPMGRDTRGVRGIRLRKDDRVVAMEPLDPLGGPVLSVTAKGYGKRTEVAEYPQQGRGGMGVINVKTGAKTGEVIAVKQVAETDGIVLITQEGKILRTQAVGVRQTGRGAMGVKLMDLEGEDRLIAAARISEREEDADLQGEGPQNAGPSGDPGGLDDDGDDGDDTPPDTIH
ncbi:MAG TPA: DNA gyrase C-terminal beta-propeller domain-containing protein, partial [Thermoanaerobaculia bacterium]|nr:DNA gyrase C-terminal beta-propeller domain-containing protein [Thermoanaerobaculia bacterium]